MYDISIMSADKNGRLTYGLPSLSGKISGREKLTQHFIKHLYDDNIGGLIKLLTEKRSWDDGDIVNCVYLTVRHMKRLQANRSLHPDEKLEGASIKRMQVDKKAGKVDIEISIKSAGSTSTITI